VIKTIHIINKTTLSMAIFFVQPAGPGKT